MTDKNPKEKLAGDLFSTVLRNIETNDLLEALTARGVVVEIATKHGPEESWWYGSDGVGRCLSCRFFVLSSTYKSGRGECRIRSTGGAFPARRAGEWCGEHKARLPTQADYHQPPVEGKIDNVPHLVWALDQVRQYMVKFLAADAESKRKATFNAPTATRILELIDLAGRLGMTPERLKEFEDLLGEPIPSFLGQHILDTIDQAGRD